MSQPPAQTIKTADLIINESTQQVYKSNQLIKLTDLSFQTLLALIKVSPKTLSIEELIDQVWKNIEVSPETVTQRIAMLRKVLSEGEKANDKYIKSIRSKGYRWMPTVSVNVPKIAKQRMTVLFVIFLLMLLPFYYLMGFNDSPNNKLPTVISSNVSADEYTQQAWRYLDKHDAKNNRLAIELFKKSLVKKPDNLDGLVGLSFSLSHEVSKFNQPHKLLTEAVHLAQKATELYAAEAKTWAALAFAHDVNGEIDTAITYYEKSLDLNPNNSSAQGAVAYLYGIKGKLVRSLKMNLQLLGSNQEYTDLQLAQNLHLLGFVELADQWYQRADMLSPDNVFAGGLRVRFLLSNQRYEEAQLLLEQIISRGINRPEIYTLQGMLLLIHGKTVPALNSFEQAVAINAENFEAQLWKFITSAQLGVETIELNAIESNAESLWPTDVINTVIFYAATKQREKMLYGLEDAFNKGYMDSQWLIQLPPLKTYLADPAFLFWLDKIQQKADSQRHELLTVNWLPKGFLDPTAENN